MVRLPRSRSVLAPGARRGAASEIKTRDEPCAGGRADRPGIGSKNRSTTARLSRPMNDTLVFVLLAVAWIALQTWILPRMGVPT